MSGERRAYDQHIREVEYGSFSPLIFSTAGGMGPSLTVETMLCVCVCVRMFHMCVRMCVRMYTCTHVHNEA